jgi:hypothetical protein
MEPPCSSCDIRKDEIKKRRENHKKKIEHFSYEAPRNMCHYTCSSINTTNIFLFCLVLVLIYLLSREIKIF